MYQTDYATAFVFSQKFLKFQTRIYQVTLNKIIVAN